MNLAVDFGNTRVKAALYSSNQLIDFKVYAVAQDLINDKPFWSQAKNTIIGTVTDSHQQLLQQLATQNILLFKADTPVPVKNCYKSASTLGSDRIAASVGAFALFPSQNVLTIDAGTCIKYNFVNSNNEYLGGAISPGIPMRLKAMNYYTSRLPLIEPDFNYNKLVGETTSESLLSGALMGAAAEVDETINRYMQRYANLEVVLSGGDAPYLAKQLKNRIFASPEIVLAGLNTILNYNLERQH